MIDSPDVRGLPKICEEGRLNVEPASENTCVVETEEEEEAGMVLAKGDRLSCGRDDVPWCASRLEERGVLHTARSTPPPWEMGSLLLV